MNTIYLNQGREKSLRRHHPWIFSKAVDESKISEAISAGDLVKVVSDTGEFLCYGIYSPKSQIRIRALSFNEDTVPDADFFKERIKVACALRKSVIARGNDGVRLVASEGDFLPGLVVDRYNDFIVISISSLAMEVFRDTIIETFRELYPKSSGYERSDLKSRVKEGLEEQKGLLWGREPDEVIYVKEGGSVLLPVNIANGHKTGYYLDQPENRRAFPIDLHGKSVLNCFCYTGGFGLRAASLGAASVTQVDSSENALEMARKNVEANQLDESVFTYEKADVFQYLRTCRDSRKSFDLIVLDPPKLIETQAQLEKGCRGYKDLNLLALKLLNPGGALLTFSCSGAMTPELFQKVVGDAARDAGKSPRVSRILQQAPDHPLSLDIPEADYLTGLELLI